MADLSNVYYVETHEWIKKEGEYAYIGISDYAQEKMGDIVYVELPDIGDSFDMKENFAVIESVKAASEIYLPVAGEIVEINEVLEDEPALLNEAPYDNWLVKIKIDENVSLEQLMNESAYKEFCTNEVE